MVIGPQSLAVPEYYRREDCWPAQSLARYRALHAQIQAYRAGLRA